MTKLIKRLGALRKSLRKTPEQADNIRIPCC